MTRRRPRIFAGAPALAFLLLAGAAAPARAAGYGTTGADFLRLPAGARPAALGGAYDALAADPYGAPINPAGMGLAPAPGIAATYLSYLDSMNYGALSAAVPLAGGRAGGLGASVQYLSPGGVSATDAAGNPAGSFTGRYLAAGLAYGKTLAPGFSLGVGGKAVNARIQDVSASAYAADLGAMYRFGDRITFSAVAANLGSSLKFVSSSDALPRQYRFGAAVDLTPAVTLAGQGVVEDGGPGFNGGAEWRAIDALALRAGYRSEASQGLTGAAGVTLGVGLKYMGLGLDYAWVPMGTLGDTNFVSLVVTFGGEAPGGAK